MPTWKKIAVRPEGRKGAWTFRGSRGLWGGKFLFRTLPKSARWADGERQKRLMVFLSQEVLPEGKAGNSERWAKSLHSGEKESRVQTGGDK